MTDYATLLRNTYLDEARGDAFFGALVDHQPDADRREKLRTLQTIEARIVTTMRRLLEKAGIQVETGAARREGRELAQRTDVSDWDRFVGELARDLPHDVARYDALRDASPRPGDPALKALTNHARAINEFCTLEAGGDARKSLKVLTTYLRTPA